MVKANQTPYASKVIGFWATDRV